MILVRTSAGIQARHLTRRTASPLHNHTHPGTSYPVNNNQWSHALTQSTILQPSLPCALPLQYYQSALLLPFEPRLYQHSGITKILLRSTTPTLQQPQALHLTGSLPDILELATTHHPIRIGPSRAGQASGHSLIAIPDLFRVGHEVTSPPLLPSYIDLLLPSTSADLALRHKLVHLPRILTSRLRARLHGLLLSLCYRASFLRLDAKGYSQQPKG